MRFGGAIEERTRRFSSEQRYRLYGSRVPHIRHMLGSTQTKQQILWQRKYAAIGAPSRCEPPPHREAPSQETPCFQIPVNLHLLANPCLSLSSTHSAN